MKKILHSIVARISGTHTVSDIRINVTNHSDGLYNASAFFSKISVGYYCYYQNSVSLNVNKSCCLDWLQMHLNRDTFVYKEEPLGTPEFTFLAAHIRYCIVLVHGPQTRAAIRFYGSPTYSAFKMLHRTPHTASKWGRFST